MDATVLTNCSGCLLLKYQLCWFTILHQQLNGLLGLCFLSQRKNLILDSYFEFYYSSLAVLFLVTTKFFVVTNNPSLDSFWCFLLYLIDRKRCGNLQRLQEASQKVGPRDASVNSQSVNSLTDHIKLVLVDSQSTQTEVRLPQMWYFWPKGFSSRRNTKLAMQDAFKTVPPL